MNTPKGQKEQEQDKVPLKPQSEKADETLNNFDDVLHQVGDFGRFQLLVLFVLFSLEIPTVFVILTPIFVAAHPETWTCETGVGGGQSDFQLAYVDSCSCNGTLVGENGTSTIVTEWTLACETAWVTDFITSVQMVGTFVGNFFSGTFSDWYGRKYTCVGSSLIMGLGHLVSSLAPNPYVYAICRFIAGAGFSGLLGVSAMYIMEFLGTKHRQMCGTVGPWGWAVMGLGVLAYYVRPWRALTQLTSVSLAFLLLLIPLVPESPRWLLRTGKISEATEITNYIARLNGKPEITVTEATLRRIAEIENQGASSLTSGDKRATYLTLFRKRQLRRATLCLMTIWFAWACTYFFLSFNMRNMAGDPYLNVVLLGVTDAVGIPMGLLICNRLGRRKSVALCMTESALFLVALAACEVLTSYGVIDKAPNLLLTLCLLGKFGISVARGCLRALTGESFPTNCRSMGSALSGVAASAGGIVAPQLAFLGTYSTSAPYLIIAVVSITASIVSFLLRETGGRPMKEDYGSKKSLKNVELRNDLL